MAFRIIPHAIERYKERIRVLPEGREAEEIAYCLGAAKPKHKERLKRAERKRTVIVPTGCCMMVFDHGALVTVLERQKVSVG